MIITNNVLVNITNTNKKYYESKGYNINDVSLLIDVKDLPLGSHTKIKVKCSNCGFEKEIVYKNYNIQLKRGDYYCNDCKSIKIKKNTKDKYGEDSVFKIPEYQEKIRQTMIKNHGVRNALESNIIKNKMIDDLSIKYGVNNVSKIKEVKEKKIETLSKTWLNRIQKQNSYIKIIDGDYKKQLIKMECDNGKKHTFEIEYNLYHNRKQINTTLCTKCHKIGRSTFGVEDKFLKFIGENYNGIVIRNDRKTITPYELDLYLPELKIAFEFNGFNWHNDTKKDKNYHLMKYNLCKEKDIQLIQFFQDDWVYKYDIVKSIILNKLNKTPHKIYARKCSIKEISYIDTKKFMILNHIQGYASSKYNYGLVYDDKIVSVITLGERKISGEKKFELIRYGSVVYTNVIGGFSKLLKYVITELDIKELITYSNKLYSNGNLYTNNNFTYIKDTKPNYYYIISDVRKHRYSYRKDILVKQGFDKDKTEIQIMNDRNILRIYDCGNKKYIWKKE